MKRLFGCALAVAMLFSLAGCGEKGPTAEELAESAASMDMDGYMGASMSFDLAYPDGGSVDDVSFKADLERAAGVIHIDNASMMAGMEGLSMSIGLEAWIDGNSGDGYVNVSMFGEETGWTDAGLDEWTGVGIAGGSWRDVIGTLTEQAGLELQERDKKSKDDYVVRWVIDPEKLAGLLEDVVDEDSEITSAEGSMRFGFEDRALKSLALACDGVLDGERMTFDMTVDIDETGGNTVLAVPEDVMAEAASNRDGLYGFLDGSDGDEPEPWSGWSDAEGAAQGNLEIDGTGRDELLEGLGAYLADYDPAGEVYVHRYDGYANLDWYPGTDDTWSGSVALTHYTAENEYSDPRRDFEDGVDFLRDYLDMEPTYGGKGESDAVFITERNGSRLLEYVSCGDAGLYIEGTVHGYDDETDDEMMEHMLYAIGVIGSYDG